MKTLDDSLKTIREWVYKHNRQSEVYKHGITTDEMEELESHIRRLLKEQEKKIRKEYRKDLIRQDFITYIIETYYRGWSPGEIERDYPDICKEPAVKAVLDLITKLEQGEEK